MRALILVGGYGTRLRPLTLSRPKPLVDFCNKPILFHQMEALIEAGVDLIVLAVSYMCEMLQERIERLTKQHRVTIIYSKEDEPLGTAGPLALAKEHLANGDEPFFVLNSDITCTYPFKKLLAYHKSKNAQATIVVTKVDEPSKYGVVVCNSEGRILRFIEKPRTFVSNKINAGIYVLQPSVLTRIELRPTSIEKEVFPPLALEGTLFAYELEGFWMDIGQPRDYLTGVKLYLKHAEQHFSERLGTLDRRYKTALIDPSAKIGQGCHIGSDVVIGEAVVIGDGVCLLSCVIMAGSTIKSYSFIDKAIIGWKCTIGKWVRIEGYTILGEDVNVRDEVYINGAKILPHKSITESLFSPEIVL